MGKKDNKWDWKIVTAAAFTGVCAIAANWSSVAYLGVAVGLICLNITLIQKLVK